MAYQALRLRLAVMVVAGLTVALGGCPGFVVDIGLDEGTLSGRVTNARTEDGIEGVAVTLDPAVAGVTITTAANGTYSVQLPVGVYTLSFADERYTTQTRTVAVNSGLVTATSVALEPKQAVFVTASVEGSAAPGATLALRATVETLDGEATVQGYAWTASNSVEVTLSNASAANAQVTLPNAAAYKAELLTILAEPPIGAEELPPNVPLPEGEFPGGLQNRFYVPGINPFALEEAGLVTLRVTVNTTAGSFSDDVEIPTTLPWQWSAGLRNVAVGVPVLLHGRNHVDEDGDGVNDETGAAVAYNWSLSRPAGSGASLIDATSQDPYFTPDVSGVYTVTVTDTTRAPGDQVVSIPVYAGTWEGVITGQDSNGRPLAANCTGCHNDVIAPDKFTPWAQTGHAEIFTDNLNTSTHYSEECFACHTVGYYPGVNNGGVDEAEDYEDFLNAGLLNNPGDNWTTLLADFPATAQRANIQCENCHGPQNGGAHIQGSPRISLSADVCAVCHGEPLRHSRFQQWQLSGHANYELAVDEGENGSCARCHTVNGFLAWLPILLDDDPTTDPLDDVEVTWTADETHPQTCVTCHDPHSIGTTTGLTTNATVRISGDTPPLIGGFTAIGVGRGAICMTCHNSRRGLRNDSTFDTVVGTSEAARAPHGSVQADVLMGQNAFFVEVGVRGSHSFVEDTCVNCHMEQTPPPDLLSYNLGGTNHTFFASPTICAKCHDELNAEGLQTAYQASADNLKSLVELALLQLIAAQIEAGNSVDLNGLAVLDDAADVTGLDFGEASGRQAITFTLADGTTLGPVQVTAISIIDGSDDNLGPLFNFADARLIKAGWNWNLANNDGSRGVHNPPFVFGLLDAASDELTALVNGS